MESCQFYFVLITTAHLNKLFLFATVTPTLFLFATVKNSDRQLYQKILSTFSHKYNNTPFPSDFYRLIISFQTNNYILKNNLNSAYAKKQTNADFCKYFVIGKTKVIGKIPKKFRLPKIPDMFTPREYHHSKEHEKLFQRFKKKIF